jgi:hypothetical protein
MSTENRAGLITIIVTIMSFVTMHNILPPSLGEMQTDSHESSAVMHFSEPLSVLAVQFALVFALPSLRQVLPDPPIFGAYFET